MIKALSILVAMVTVSESESTDVAVRELTTSKIKIVNPRLTYPKSTLISDHKELKDTFQDEEVVASIAKEVDFSKQKLIFFVWSSSGKDRITPKSLKNEIEFEYIRGLTRDLSTHVKLFVIPKGAKFKVTVVK